MGKNLRNCALMKKVNFGLFAILVYTKASYIIELSNILYQGT